VGNVNDRHPMLKPPRAKARTPDRTVRARLGIEPRHYAVCTLHTVQATSTHSKAADKSRWPAVYRAVQASQSGSCQFNPRTSRHLRGVLACSTPFATVAQLIEPLGYLDFLGVSRSRAVGTHGFGGIPGGNAKRPSFGVRA
jgi:hypothetical protein